MLKKWFGKDEPEPEDLDVDLRLEKMKAGYLVDYDMKTWEVAACNTYDYDGFKTQEWELKYNEEVLFLERSLEDGKVEWVLSRAVSLDQISGDIAAAVGRGEEPPEEVAFSGDTYWAAESSGGTFERGGSGQQRNFISWSYEAEGDKLLFVSQWGENEFSAYAGQYVQEYQFSDILPGAGQA